MRNNQPVTQNERPLEPGRILLSRTDLKGRITFANGAFVAASGFSEEELLGKPHNLVRHPDVPEAAFDDLWKTIKAGRLWNGIVKNRAKTGDYYWVNANVTPIIANGAITGYTSVRTPASRAEIAAAEGAYALIRKNPKITSRLLHPGRSYRNVMRWSLGAGLLGLGATAAALVLASPLAAAAGISVAAGALMAIGWSGLDLAVQVAGCETRMMRIQADGAVGERLPAARSREVNDLARSFNALMSGFQAMAGDIQRTSQELQTALSGLAQSNQQIRDSSEKQTQATETTAATVEQVTVSIGEVAHRTTETANIGREAQELAASGNKVAEQASAEIDLIAQAIGDSAEKLDELGQRSGDIARIVSVIREIADQTNLLALNAAIEAARAGEQGRGFAVVADEVRKLAQRTAQATTEITDVTAVIQSGTSTAVSAMQTSVERVHRGVALTRDAAAALARIQTGADQTATALGEIETATREQGIASAEIAQQVEKISQMTAKNNDALQDNLAVFADLQRLSAQLSDAARRFRSDGR